MVPLFSVAGFIVAGLALRMLPLVRDPLHQDEALYGFWGRLIGAGRDRWLATVPADKPPLVPYLIAASQAVFGGSEFSLRLLGLAASLVSIPLTYCLARRLYANRVTGLIAAAVMALTPYAVLFGATGFTDPILVAWWLAACWAALAGRWGWAGLLLGLAFASKQQAIALAPLVIGLGIAVWRGRAISGSSAAQAAAQVNEAARKWPNGARFLLGLFIVVAVVFVWDAIRIAGGAVSGFWGQGVDSYGGLRLIWSPELKPRLSGWARLAGYLFGWPWQSVLFLPAVGMLVWFDLTRQRRTNAALADLALVTFACIYLFCHWLLAFPVWDRYLLPIVPVVALLLGRMVTVFLKTWQSKREKRQQLSRGLALAFLALLIVSLAGSGLMAARGRIPVGGDHGAYDGLTELAAYLRALPVGTVLYDRWLSWHYDYYLFNAYLYRAGFPSPEWLATDAATFYDGRPRYVVLPGWESSARLERALAEVDLEMSPAFVTKRPDGETSFVVYEIGTRHTEPR